MEADALAPFVEGWEDGAACYGADLSLFFAPNYFERKAVKDAREARAKAYCRVCPVIDRCLEFAMMSGQPYGVWGGLNERERRLLARRRAVLSASIGPA